MGAIRDGFCGQNFSFLDSIGKYLRTTNCYVAIHCYPPLSKSSRSYLTPCLTIALQPWSPSGVRWLRRTSKRLKQHHIFSKLKFFNRGFILVLVSSIRSSPAKSNERASRPGCFGAECGIRVSKRKGTRTRAQTHFCLCHSSIHLFIGLTYYIPW